MAAAREPERRERELFGRLRLALPRLDTLLRAEGFVVGPDRWQNVYDLLLALEARGRMPPQAAALRSLLTPCSAGMRMNKHVSLWCSGTGSKRCQPSRAPLTNLHPPMKKPHRSCRHSPHGVG